jgi:hypothetical protein
MTQASKDEDYTRRGDEKHGDAQGGERGNLARAG